MRRIQLIVGVLVCIVLPGASYLDGTGRLAYTMFAEISEHRVEISIATAHGAFVLPPTRLARRAGVFLAGSERFVPGPVHRVEHLRSEAGLRAAAWGTHSSKQPSCRSSSSGGHVRWVSSLHAFYMRHSR